MLFAGSLSAFYSPLQQTQIREAYLLGHSSDTRKLAELLNPYTRRFPLPPSGPRVESIEFGTPYEQVVRRSWEHSNDYDLDRAEKDYAVQPDLVVVSVVIYAPEAHSDSATHSSDAQARPSTTGDDSLGFQFLVSQQRSIEPQKMRSKSLYAGRYDKGTRKEVLIEFDANEFSPGTAKILVTASDGQTIVAEFDLDTLK